MNKTLSVEKIVFDGFEVEPMKMERCPECGEPLGFAFSPAKGEYTPSCVRCYLNKLKEENP